MNLTNFLSKLSFFLILFNAAILAFNSVFEGETFVEKDYCFIVHFFEGNLKNIES